jgi:6-phosphogluconolactonase (cycloisomerase 2 family)
MNIDPSGNWLVVGGQDDNVIKSFRINTKTGKITPSGFSLAVSKPVDICF